MQDGYQDAHKFTKTFFPFRRCRLNVFPLTSCTEKKGSTETDEETSEALLFILVCFPYVIGKASTVNFSLLLSEQAAKNIMESAAEIINSLFILIV